MCKCVVNVQMWECANVQMVAFTCWVIEYEQFFASLKNILTSQIQKKNIKDTKKFLGNIIIEIVKIAEEYKEN